VIIILSGADDLTSDRVASELARRSVRFARLDLSDFPQCVVATAYLDGSGRWTGQIRHADGWTVNHPFQVADCEFKPVQLAVAQDCGFAVPATVITNDGRSAHSFASVQPRGVVYKALGGGFYRDTTAAGGFSNAIPMGNGDSSRRPRGCRSPVLSRIY
jgi:hypothetical protein